jgi:low affinity Fe/Cu permease
MWFLSFIPDWILQWAIHGLVILGLVLTFIGSLVKFIPVIQPYALVGRQVGIVLLLIGVYFEGGYGVEMSYRARIAEMQAKIKEAEVKSAKLNEKLTVEVGKNKELIREKVNRNAKDIEAKREAINAECKLSDDAWVLYNRAVEPKVSRSSSSANGARSGSKASK